MTWTKHENDRSMKRLLKLLAPVLLFTFLSGVEISAQNASGTTVKERMAWIEGAYGVSFIYDSNVNLSIPYKGSGSKDTSVKLKDALRDLFKGTGMEWDIKRKYISVRAYKPSIESIHAVIDPETLLDTLAASRITSYIDRDLNTTQTGLTRIDGKAFNRGFAVLSSPDVIKTLQILPGVAAGTELMSSLYVHGGDGSDNLFLLDGVPVYQVSHLLGLYSAFNTDAVESLDFYKSGFPARFGGRTSSVVDMATKQGSFDSYSGTFSIGLINAQMQYGGPVVRGRTSFNIALRHSWLDTFSWPLFRFIISDNGEKYHGSYRLFDINLNLTHKFSDKSILSLNFYDGKDFLNYGYRSFGERTRSYEDETAYEVYMKGDERMNIGLKWGNVVGSVQWKVDFSPILSMRLMAYHTGTMGLVDYGYFDYQKRDFSGIEWEGPFNPYEDRETETSYNTSNYSRIRDYALKADFDIVPSRVHHVRTGLGYQLHHFRPERATVSTMKDFDQLDTTMTDGYQYRYTAHEVSLYAEDEMTLSRRLKVNAGLRYTLYAIDGKASNYFEPRLALKYQFSDFGSAKLSYTQMNQFVHQVTTFYAELPTSLWMPSTRKVAPMHSSQIAGGIYTDLPGGFHVDLEGWYKTMSHLLEYSGQLTLFPPVDSWEKTFCEGIGKSYGFETTLSYTRGKMEATAGYTLSWTMRKFDDIAIDWYPDRNDNRHKLNLMLTYRPTRKIDLYAGWLFHTGSRITIPTHDVVREFYRVKNTDSAFRSRDEFKSEEFVGPYNLRMAPYHRLDIGANFRHVTKKGNEAIWNISIYNAYCRMNPFTAATSEVVDIKFPKSGTFFGHSFTGISVVPIIPTFSYTLKF